MELGAELWPVGVSSVEEEGRRPALAPELHVNSYPVTSTPRPPPRCLPQLWLPFFCSVSPPPHPVAMVTYTGYPAALQTPERFNRSPASKP